jgi:hypothetical protein
MTEYRIRKATHRILRVLFDASRGGKQKTDWSIFKLAIFEVCTVRVCADDANMPASMPRAPPASGLGLLEGEWVGAAY